MSIFQGEAGVLEYLQCLHVDTTRHDLRSAREERQQAEEERDEAVKQLEEIQGERRMLQDQLSTTAGELKASQAHHHSFGGRTG